jgi:hypothetical protein
VHMGDRAVGRTVVGRWVDGEALSGTAAWSRARGRRDSLVEAAAVRRAA